MLTIQTAPHFQPEKEYILYVLLTEMLGVAYQLEYKAVNGHRIRLPNGAELYFQDEFEAMDHLPEIPEPDAQLAFSKVYLPDIFAASFRLLTCLEETQNSARDEHGRFPANASILGKNGRLDRPVVNEWAEWLWQCLLHLGWKGERKRRSFQISFSCDVDHPRLWWSAADRLKTLGGALLKRGDFKEAVYWLQYHSFRKKDPYDVFEEWFDFFESIQLVAQFNFMGERPASSDCWYPLQHPYVKNLMANIAARGHRIGFHPSYEAFGHQAVFDRELATLKAASPLEISAGRQHYLRFEAPKTWQMWESANLLADSTLGFPEAEGFRCGICHDFPVFDTQNRKMLRLREQPLIAMDITLAQYRRYSPEQALEQLQTLRKQVALHGGVFTLLWHNSSWNTAFWEPWKSVFYKFLAG